MTRNLAWFDDRLQSRIAKLRDFDSVSPRPDGRRDRVPKHRGRRTDRRGWRAKLVTTGELQSVPPQPSPPPQSHEPKQWAGFGLTVVLLGSCVGGVAVSGLMPAGNWAAGVAIGVLFFISCLKISVAPKLSSEGFTFAKQGHDFCQLALSSSLTGFALQWAVDEHVDVLPGARRILAELHFVPLHSVGLQNIMVFITLGTLSLVGYAFTAFQVGEIRRDRNSRWAPARALGCYFAGAMAMSGNILVLIAK